VAARKLVVSTYLQYILIALGAVLLVTFVRQIGGVLLTFFMAAILAYALNPLVRLLEGWRIPRVLAVLGVFAALVVITLAGLLILIIPAVRQVQNLIQDPSMILDGIAALVGRAEKLPYVGERVAELDQEALLGFVRANAPSPGTVLDGALGFLGGVFGVFGTILNLFLTLIVSIYFLLDRERIERALLRAIPETVREQAVELYHATERTLVSYLKAQLLLCGLRGPASRRVASVSSNNGVAV
jgi:predicted PurR-regulated permease PerM